MSIKNFANYTNILKDLPMFLSLGYIPKEHGELINKFSRTNLENNMLVTLSSFNESVSVTDFKPFNDTLVNLFINSSSTSDTHDIKVFYVNGDRDRKEVVVTLQGTTLVNLSALANDTIYCIWRMENPSSTDNVGTVEVVNGSGDIYCNMPITSGISANASLTGIFSIPRGYVGLLLNMSTSSEKGADAKGAILDRKEGGVFAYEYGLATYQAQSKYNNIFTIVEEKTDILPVAIAQTGGVLYLEYQIMLLKKEYLGSELK